MTPEYVPSDLERRIAKAVERMGRAVVMAGKQAAYLPYSEREIVH